MRCGFKNITIYGYSTILFQVRIIYLPKFYESARFAGRRSQRGQQEEGRIQLTRPSSYLIKKY